MTQEHRRVSVTPAESAFPLPSSEMKMLVTPDMASDWVTFRNHPGNRPISKVVTARYLDDMTHDRWLQGSPQGLTFDTEGYLIDGQHRLKAQANSGLTLEWRIFPNEPHATFKVFDSGFKRQAAHVLGMPYSHNTATTLRYLAALADQDRYAIGRYSKVGTQEILETRDKWPEVAWYMDKLQGIWRAASIPVGAHGAVLAQAARTAYVHKIPEWLTALYDGAIADRRDPRLILRNRYITHQYYPTSRLKRDVDYAHIVKAWNGYITGEFPQYLRFAATEQMPQVVGFDWDKPEG